MWHDMSWHGWGGHMFSWWGILVMGALIAAAAFLIWRSDSEPTSENQRAIDTLKQRYAAGEIDRDEFEQKRADIDNETTRR